jgi:hypothetical protein
MKKGFSLIELLIYTGLFAVAAGLLTGITLTVTRVQTQESASLEVTKQSQFIMQRVQNLVRQSSNIEEPVCVGDICSLKLRMENSALDPTCITVENDIVKLAQGPGVSLDACSSTKVNLTTDKVKVGMLKFSKIVNPGGHSIVNVDLTLNYNSTNPILSGASKRLTSAVSRVSAATFDSNLLPNANNTLSIGAAGTTWKNILMVDGTAASPSYSFGLSSTTGIFSPGAGIIGFSTGGSERMRIDATGNVGIGTTSPTNILSLGNASARKFWIENTAAGTVGRALTIAAGGTVAGTADITGGNLILQSGLGTGTGASNISFQTGTTLTTGTTLQTMSTKMTILGNGNVGIGTATPGQKLTVAGTIESTSGGIKFPDGTTQATAASGSTPTGVTVVTRPVMATGAVSDVSLASLTVYKTALFQAPSQITVNQLAYNVGVVTTAGSYRICVYNEAGTTKLIDVTDVPTAGVNTAAVAGAVLNPGNYYVAMGCATACSNTITMFTSTAATWINTSAVPAGKKVYEGIVTMTSGTCDATLPAITGAVSSAPVMRLDN